MIILLLLQWIRDASTACASLKVWKIGEQGAKIECTWKAMAISIWPWSRRYRDSLLLVFIVLFVTFDPTPECDGMCDYCLHLSLYCVLIFKLRAATS